jgi:hypothetical protein
VSEVGGLLGKLLFAVSSDYLISKKLVGAAHLITCKSFQGLSVSLADSQGSLSQSTGPASVGSSSLPLHSSLFLPRPSILNNTVVDGGVVWIWILGWRDGGHVQSLSDGECASSSVSHFSWHRRLPHTSSGSFSVGLHSVQLCGQPLRLGLELSIQTDWDSGPHLYCHCTAVGALSSFDHTFPIPSQE